MRDGQVFYEILIEVDSGVLSPVAVHKKAVSIDKYDYISRSYKLELFFHEFMSSINQEFNVEDKEHWRVWYLALIYLGINKDKIIIEHEHGVYLVTQGIWDKYAIRDFIDTLKPMNLPRTWDLDKMKWTNKAKKARKIGFLQAKNHINNRVSMHIL
tara:strand:- start:849 stop:1316 length:468 start_codon:yes stop_codon:yes gene_type:complete